MLFPVQNKTTGPNGAAYTSSTSPNWDWITASALPQIEP